jgi:hypothetical protein
MKKTVIQKIIADIEVINSRGIELTPKGILIILENSLGDEKKQIMDAFEEGVGYEQSLLGKVDYPASRYYHGTFETNKRE